MSYGGMIPESLVRAFGDGTTLGELTAALATKADQTAVDAKADQTALDETNSTLFGVQALGAKCMGDDGLTVATDTNRLTYPQGTFVTHKWVVNDVIGDDISIDEADASKVVFARIGLYLAQLTVGTVEGGSQGTTLVSAGVTDTFWQLGFGQQQDRAAAGNAAFSWLFVPYQTNQSVKFVARFFGGSASDHGFNNTLVCGRIA